MEGRAAQADGERDRSGSSAAAPPDGASVVSEFASVVVSLLAERSVLRARAHTSPPRDTITASFVAAALSGTARSFESLLAHFRKNRISYAMVADVYIPEAARQMGESWLNDDLSWVDVSMGTARLQSLLREIGAAWNADQADILGLGAVLLLVPPGEQHTLGPMVAMGQLRRMGVSVCLRFAPSQRELTELLKEKRFDGVLVSVATEGRIQPAAALVRYIRTIGKNLPPIVVGGPIVMEKPQLIACIEADFTCIDIDTAMEAIGLKVDDLGSLKRA